MLSPRLAWVPELQACVNRATGGQFRSFTVITGVDHLKAFIKFDLHEDLAPGDFHPFRNISQGFASANGCVLERLHRGESSITLEVLLKRRLGPIMKKNPILSGKT